MPPMDDDKPDRWELRRPDLVLRELQVRYPFDIPRTLLARIDGAWSDQRLTAATELWRHPAVDEFERTSATERALGRLGLGFAGTPDAECPIVVVVTAHGWYSQLDHLFGRHPAAAWSEEAA